MLRKCKIIVYITTSADDFIALTGMVRKNARMSMGRPEPSTRAEGS
jgi:hypothetical protein